MSKRRKEYDVIWCVKDDSTFQLKSYSKTFNTLREAMNYQKFLFHTYDTEYSTIKTYIK